MDSTAPPPNSSPPILARLHDAPTAQGLAIPFLTLRHRGPGSPVWGAIDPERYALVLALRLCQVCGEKLGHGHGPGRQVVVFVRPQDWVGGVGPEAGLHPECAAYSTCGCPMLAGRMPAYRSNAIATRIAPCGDPECGCPQWIQPGPESEEATRAGKPADAWYSILLDARDYRIVPLQHTESGPATYGVDLRGLRIRRLRRVRGTAGATPTILDQLAAVLDVDRLTS
ncbi:hypothetical protein ACFXO9_26635 [Nocardia tengchongensis]|uniref:hypothetical protein n=1 Tax=Nocardia tengchongensis TaxID=2055889 RepID=UPI0036A7B78E